MLLSPSRIDRRHRFNPICQLSREALARLGLIPTAALIAGALFLNSRAGAQGCVAIKQMDGSEVCSMDGHAIQDPTKWALSLNYEHFRSHRHFSGTDQNFARYDLGSEVINVVNEVDAVLAYQVDPRDDLYVDVPYFNATRSSLYEHDGVHRYTTHGIGMGDMRVGGERWLWDPTQGPAHNVAVGAALEIPTGKSNVKDWFHTRSGLQYHNVDQSIQLGEGAWGFALTAQAYQRLNTRMALYASGFYLFMPQEHNGTRTTAPITSPTAYFSVYDEFQARVGINYLLWTKHSLTGSLGWRLEGVPSSDVFGGDAGFRRPGYVESIEPGLSISPTRRDTFTLSVPVAIVRNRTLSYADKLNGGHGDAAFADYLINASYTRRW